MKRFLRLILFLSIVVMTTPLGATMDGELWNTLSDDIRFGYAGGFWEAMIFFAPPQRPEMTGPGWEIRYMAWSLTECMKKKGISPGQFKAMIDSYVRQHPAEAKHKMAVTASNALDKICAP